MRKLRIILALPDFTARVDVPDAGRRQLREAHFEWFLLTTGATLTTMLPSAN
jgi:hypothetical protein